MKTTLRAILTDSHFWVPLAVLGIGLALLLHLV
ncbi:MAG TPA: translocated intimin receptor Tir [Acidobacteriaceae bacterium]